MDLPNSLDTLRILTKELPPPLHDLRENGGFQKISPIRYEMVGGIGWGYPLLKYPDMAVQRVWMPAGASFKAHTHPVREWVFTISGLYVLADGPQAGKSFPAGAIAIFEPGEPHGSEPLKEATWVMCWTVPADMEGYPDVA